MNRGMKGLVTVALLVIAGVAAAQVTPNEGQDRLGNRPTQGIPNEQTAARAACGNVASADTGPLDEASSEPTPAALPGGAGPDACGVIAYENAYNGAPYYMDLWPGVHTADDCRLTGTGRDVCRVTSVIYNPNYTPATVYMELWSACPVQGGTLLATSPALSAQPTASTKVTWDLNPPVTVPETVWVGWRTLQYYVGPLVSGQAEVGYTNNYLYLTTCSGGPSCYCSWMQFWAGLDVTIHTASLTHPGDLNCDGAVNAFDIDPFVLALTNPTLYQQTHPNCNILNGDINGDGAVNAFDIDPFVVCITLGACP